MSHHPENLAAEHCKPNAAKLTDGEAAKLLAALHGWKRANNAIVRRFPFDDFHHTMAFVNALAWVAHRQDHHPDLDVGYEHCTVTWSTHSAGGLTRNDFICAARTEALVDV